VVGNASLRKGCILVVEVHKRDKELEVGPHKGWALETGSHPRDTVKLLADNLEELWLGPRTAGEAEEAAV